MPKIGKKYLIDGHEWPVTYEGVETDIVWRFKPSANDRYHSQWTVLKSCPDILTEWPDNIVLFPVNRLTGEK